MVEKLHLGRLSTQEIVERARQQAHVLEGTAATNELLALSQARQLASPAVVAWMQKFAAASDEPAAAGGSASHGSAGRPELKLFRDCGPGSKADIGWALALDPHWQQRLMTDEFNRLADAARAGDRTPPPNADQYAYLFVPGLFTKHYLGYMSDNMRRLQELGCKTVVKSKIDTDNSVAVNAAVLKQEIEDLAAKTGKKVIVLGHSKGGVDASAAFQLHPELSAHVKAFISMQAPFAGTPIASDLGDVKEVKHLMNSFIRDVFHGDPTSLADLSYAARRAFLGKTVDFTAKIPTYSFATASSDAGSITALSALYVRNRYEKPCDGLVAREDAIIPGSRGIILLDGIDHAAPAMRGPFNAARQPGDITQALVAMALSH